MITSSRSVIVETEWDSTRYRVYRSRLHAKRIVTISAATGKYCRLPYFWQIA